jgi:hypothetical protein
MERYQCIYRDTKVSGQFPFRGGVSKFSRCAAPNGMRALISSVVCDNITRISFAGPILFRNRTMPFRHRRNGKPKMAQPLAASA